MSEEATSESWCPYEVAGETDNLDLVEEYGRSSRVRGSWRDFLLCNNPASGSSETRLATKASSRVSKSIKSVGWFSQ